MSVKTQSSRLGDRYLGTTENGLYGGEVNSVIATPFELPSVPVPASPTQTLAIEQGFDDVGAQTGAFKSGGHTDDSTPRLTGTAAPNAVVELWDSMRGYLGSTTAGPDGIWTFDVSRPLGIGEHSMFASSDGQISADFKFTLDAPVAPPIEQPNVAIQQGFDDVGAQTGAFKSGGHTDDSTPRLTGTAAPNAVVELWDSVRGYLGSTTAGPDGIWTFDVSRPLGIGEHSMFASSDGQISADFKFTLDAPVAPPIEQPNVAIQQGHDDVTGHDFGNGSVIDDTTPRLSGTAAPDAYVNIYLDGRHAGYVLADAKGQWSFDLPASFSLAAGEHTFRAVVNGDNSDPFVLTVDPSSPTVLAIRQGYDDVTGDDFANGSLINDATPHLSGTAEPNAYINIYGDGKNIGQVVADAKGQWSFDVIYPLTAGEHSFTAVVNGQSSASFDVNVDASSPTLLAIRQGYDDVTGEAFGNGSVIGDTIPNLSGTAEPNAYINIYCDGTNVGQVVADAKGQWSFDVIHPLAAGEHVFSALAYGQNSASFALTVDAMDPVPTRPSMAIIEHVYDNSGGELIEIPCYGHTLDGTPHLTGTADPGALVTFNIYPFGDVGQAYANAKGEWTFDVSLELAPGRYAIVATVEGNWNTAPFVFDVDAAGHSAAPNHQPDGLSVSDVLSANESELFVSDHAQEDSAQLSVDQVETAAMVDVPANNMNAAIHDVSGSNANLMLPHEQVTHVVM